MTRGRRLRLDRRKAGLSQQELADRLGHTLEEISQMENDRLELSTAAQAFCSSIPARAPRKPPPPKPKAEPPVDDVRTGVEEEQDGPGPRVELPDGGDKPPTPAPTPKRELAVPRGEIAELEDALLKMFAGERLVVPKRTPDGVVQVEAVIPGIAQAVGMFDEFDGMIIEQYSPGMAKAWAELARVNPGVRRVLMGLTYGGAYRGVMAASLPPLIAICAHHGLIPGFGQPDRDVIPPEPQPDYEPPPAHEWNGGVPVEVETLFDTGPNA